MGLMDTLLNAALGSGSANSANPASLLTALIGFVNNQPGGIAGFVEKLKQGGLADAVGSWIGTGQNKPVTGAQIGEALGEDALQELAQHTGGDVKALTEQLATLLPVLIDHATPDGTVPATHPANLTQELLGAVPQLLAKLGK